MSRRESSAAELYDARLVRVRDAWWDRIFGWVLLCCSTALAGFDLDVPEPRWRVVVFRRGAPNSMGVREALTRRRALAELREVEEILRGSSEAEARLVLELDF